LYHELEIGFLASVVSVISSHDRLWTAIVTHTFLLKDNGKVEVSINFCPTSKLIY